MENKNITLNILKGLAITLVVYAHIIQRIMVLSRQDFFAHPVFKIIYTFHMPVFVFVSGYLLSHSLSRRGIGDVFMARCRGLLIPYLSWGTLGVVTFYVLDFIDGKTQPSHLWKSWVTQIFIDPQVWFLSMLFGCSAVLLFTIKLQKHFGTGMLILTYGALLFLPGNPYGSLYYIKWFYLFYITGYLVKQYAQELIKKWSKPGVILGCFILFVLLVPYWSENDYIYVNKMNVLSSHYVLEIARYGYRYFIGFLGIIVLGYFGALLAKTPAARFWDAIGIYSLDIYLLQRYLVEGLFPRLVERAGFHWDAHSLFFLAVIAPACAAALIGCCLLISKFFIRRIPLFNFLLLGRRG